VSGRRLAAGFASRFQLGAERSEIVGADTEELFDLPDILRLGEQHNAVFGFHLGLAVDRQHAILAHNGAKTDPFGGVEFADLAAAFSEGPERHSEGRIGPVPLTQAHPTVAEKLRISQPGQLWQPFFLVDIWLVLRLDRWEGARLEDQLREELLNELFYAWLQHRVMQLLAGETPNPLPLHMLS
jgi:hypothetical protein